MKHEMTRLSDPDDRIIWERVARSVRPLHPRVSGGRMQTLPEKGLEAEPKGRLEKQGDGSVSRSHSGKGASIGTGVTERAGVLNEPKQTASPTTLNALDYVTRRKIARGRVVLEARLDLHGLTQVRAHTLLLHFLQSAQSRGLRHVLVITGKGASSGGAGVLRQVVPHWLATAPFRLYVNAFEDAARHHGGAGALYVRIRRLKV